MRTQSLIGMDSVQHNEESERNTCRLKERENEEHTTLWIGPLSQRIDESVVVREMEDQHTGGQRELPLDATPLFRYFLVRVGLRDLDEAVHRSFRLNLSDERADPAAPIFETIA